MSNVWLFYVLALHSFPFPHSLFPCVSDRERVSRIKVLSLHKDFVNVVGVRGLTRQLITQHLEDVPKAPGIIDVDVSHPFVAFGEKCQLQISSTICSLKASSG